ncbi:MAG: hypothetical protein WC256_12870 [Desulfurivibrionaceae bacterium]|jgi:hypothetical protein
MKSRIITSAVVVALVAALCAGEVFAAGRGNGGTARGTRVTTGTSGTSVTPPAGSQRRDGTFLTTGTTASGATTRPSNGRGLQDGSRQ